MELTKKIKIALDETRMLTLGAQVLLGFQFQSLFSQRFEALTELAKDAAVLSLALLLTVIGLLIAPGHFHRIAEKGEDTARANRIITFFGSTALLPFSFSLGLGLFTGSELDFGQPLATFLAAIFTLIALFFWYGLAGLSKLKKGGKEQAMHHEETKTPLDTKVEQMLTEARVILPGVQALLGFQLSVLFTNPFADLPDDLRYIHGVSLCLMALAVILLMTPAAYHRLVYSGENTPEFYRLGSFLVSTATLPLALGLSGDFFVAVEKTTSLPEIAMIAGGVAACALLGLWQIFPLVMRQRTER